MCKPNTNYGNVVETAIQIAALLLNAINDPVPINLTPTQLQNLPEVLRDHPNLLIQVVDSSEEVPTLGST